MPSFLFKIKGSLIKINDKYRYRKKRDKAMTYGKVDDLGAGTKNRCRVVNETKEVVYDHSWK